MYIDISISKNGVKFVNLITNRFNIASQNKKYGKHFFPNKVPTTINVNDITVCISGSSLKLEL